MDLVELSVVTPDPLDPGQLETAVAAADAGATVVFQGVVRDHDPQATGTVTGLEYSAHPDATRFLRDVVAEANISVHNPQDTEPLPVRVAAAHRIGPLNVGETALVVAVSAAHRQEAFSVCSAVVENIKSSVPIWKQQFGPDGSHWVGI
ncbi:MAG TPA: molybdenum cofactor biosynthesis protein MoaE [Candidatus Yaniella excrementigallinarum]|nr:molybdenum cofactor biosynthesis protein MoaE [Candidatus Yaniella excrementigallinarum]